jgi:hypothetical protein
MARYGVGVDHPDRDAAWQTDDLNAAHLTAALESLGGTAVVCEFTPDGGAATLATYRDGALA